MNKKNIHLYLCLLFYISSLFFTAFYTGIVRERHETIDVLLWGWLGHVSWYANVLLLAALIKFKNRKLSYMLASISLFLALIFLFSEKIAFNAVPSYTPITGYGIGYLLWVASIISLCIGQFTSSTYSNNKNSEIIKIAGLLTAYILLASTYFAYYFFGENSLHQINKNRGIVFAELCKKSRTIINRVIDTPTSIYIQNYYYGQSFKKWPDKAWHPDTCCGIPLNENNLPTSMLFLERGSKNSKGLEIERVDKGIAKKSNINKISSAYGVFIERAEIDEKYNIDSVTVKVFEMKSGDMIASTSYAFNGATGELCTDLAKPDYFSLMVFLKTIFFF